ncbi:MAG: S8 family serine peptidase, partial [Gemmatimonadetes bacterium]|nr:S8 family serine peptidase [Gemmatimonadota bacterium]
MTTKTGLQAAVWMAAVLLALASPGSSLTQGGPPNLKPYQPEGWSEAIVVSTRQGDHLNARRLTSTDSLYVDFAVINSGGSPVRDPFRIDLYLDGALWDSFDAPAGLAPRAYRFREDYLIRRLAPGTHTLRIVADGGGAVPESDESDNDYTRTLIVGGDCTPLATRISPRGGGTLDPNRAPNCGESTAGISSLPTGRDTPGGRLKLGGEPVERARRERVFSALRARVHSEDRVRVIVGLQTEGEQSSVAALRAPGPRERPAPIARAQQALSVRMRPHNVSSIRDFKFMPYVAMEVDRRALEALAADPEVVTIEEEVTVTPSLAQSTALIGGPQAWSQGYAGAGQTIAVLDTGVDGNHPFLAGKVVSEACYSGGGSGTSFCPGGARESILPGSGAPCPPEFSNCFHATAVAGVAAGRGGEFSGVARDARIIAIQVFAQCGSDCIESTNSDWLAGLERVLELTAGYEIAAANMSFGGVVAHPEDCDADYPAVKAAMDNLRAAGIAPIGTSGNGGSDTRIDFPGCISGVISVGSVDGDTTPEAVSRFSNSSPQLDLLAPGRGIYTSVPAEGFDEFKGTSMAAPHVAGAWAVLKSKAPAASVPDLLSVLSQTGVPVTDSRNDLIRPRIQVDAALDAILPQMSYASGTRLALTASPYPGYRFTLWRGCDEEEGNRCIVAMDATRRVTAVFEPLGSDHPDLVTTSLTGPRTATAGSEAALSASVRNQGSVDAGPFRLGFYLSEDPEITADDTWFAACTYEEGLEAGETASCRRAFPVPLETPPGRYTLGAVVDDLDRVAERSETNNALPAASGTINVLASRFSSRSFIPAVLSAEGRRDSFFTSELILTNRGSRAARLDFTYTAHAGGGSGRASDTLAPRQQKIARDALSYLRRLGVPVRGSGNRIGTLAVEARGSVGVGTVVRTTTRVPEGRAGLAYPGIAAEAGFHEEVYLCGLRQNSRDRSNLALQHMGAPEDGPITLNTAVFSGDRPATAGEALEEVTLEPGGFHQFTGVLGSVRNGHVSVYRSDGDAPFYAYGVINDQSNSDGSFVFPVTRSSLSGTLRHTLPVIVETGEFTSELTVTNFSGQTKTLQFDFVADGLATPDRTARFTLTLEDYEQRIIPDVIHTEMRRKGV